MSGPLLPAIDAAGQLREAAFAVLVRDRRPVRLDVLARLTGLEPQAVGVVTGTLAGAGWLDLDDSGRVTGAAGLSLATGPHGLTLGGKPFRTWCAYDALGIAAAFGADALVETACGHCGEPIRIEFGDGIPSSSAMASPNEPARSGSGWRTVAGICATPSAPRPFCSVARRMVRPGLRHRPVRDDCSTLSRAHAKVAPSGRAVRRR